MNFLIMDNLVARYVKEWQLHSPQLLTETKTSILYKVRSRGNIVVLKLLKSAGINDEKNGAMALRYFNGQSAIRLYRCDENAMLIEYVDGESLSSLVERGDDEKAMEIIAEILNNLHAANPIYESTSFMPLQIRFSSLFEKAANEHSCSDSIYVRAASCAKELLATSEGNTVLHGDIHHDNIRFSSLRGWLAMDPKGLIGDRAYDAANIFLNPWHLTAIVEDSQRIRTCGKVLARKMDLELSRVLRYAFVHAALSASWELEDGDDPSHAMAVAGLIESCF